MTPDPTNGVPEPIKSNVVRIGPNPFRELWNLGYRNVVPILPPNAPLHPESRFHKALAAGRDARGKAPGCLGPDGFWRGYPWLQHQADEADLDRWFAMRAGAGVKSGHGLAPIDADLTSEVWAAAFERLIEKRIGRVPKRIGRAPKCIYLVRTDPDVPYLQLLIGAQEAGVGDRIEVLGAGRQFVAWGVHPKTMQPYRWLSPLVPFEQLPYISKADLLALLEEARSVLPASSDVKVERGQSADAPNQETLRAPSLEMLAAAVRATPNTNEHFPSREHYLGWGYAIKASAAPDEWPEAFDIFEEWARRWTDGDNPHDITEADWLRMKPPFRRGWQWVSEVSEKLSGGLWSRAAQWFEPPPDEEPPASATSIFGEHVFGDPVAIAEAKASAGPFAFTIASAVADIVPPVQPWAVKGVYPAGQVCSLGGPGGSGKSLLALQLAVAAATETEWLGQPVAPGKALFLTAEDEQDELLRRLHAIDTMRLEGTPSAYTDRLALISLEGEDAVLASALRRDGLLGTTPVYERLRRTVGDFGMAGGLLVLDTQADLFGGDENNRIHARQFVGFLKKINKEFSVTTLLLYHPSLSGMNSGAGTSGNTAWTNSVRAQSYFNRKFSDDKKRKERDPDLREFSLLKGNRTQSGLVWPVRYSHGVFVREDLRRVTPECAARVAASEEAFKRLMGVAMAAGRNVSANKRASNYAPDVLSGLDVSGEWGAIELAEAMNRLMAGGGLRVESYGKPSNPHERLALTGGLFD